MSENQSPPSGSNPVHPVPAVDLHLQQESVAPTNGIEKRQILSPVSPHPVHIQEPSTIPVLKNQMDPAFNFTADTQTQSNGTATTVQSNPPLDSLLQQLQQRSNQQREQRPEAPMGSFSGVIHPIENSSIVAGNGDVPSGDGSLTSQINGAVPANIATSGLPQPPTLASNLPSNVDLQALLTKLSPATSATGPQHPLQPGGSTQPPSQNQEGAGVLSTSSGAPGVQTTSTVQGPPPSSSTQSPVQKARPATNPPPPPANHPLPPVPVVSSSVPGHPATGYPASLPPPPNFKTQDPGPADGEDDEDIRPFTVDEEEEFVRFLADERDYVTQGQWDRFPPGSRLFIGNLPTEKVTKRDLFRIFHKHGRLAQVSIKQAYGFIQFLDQNSCAAALRHEQGSSVRGRKMHLEISKPQRNTRPSNVDSARPRRSRSPDYSRGGGGSPRRTSGAYRSNGASAPREVDRYRGPSSDSRDRGRDRDDYGRRRSPPPLRARDDYRPGRGRSRSRSPPRYRARSRTPDFDDVPLPRRAPDQVPEVQILVSDELDRNFIWWVEQAFRQRGSTCDMLFLNPRLQLSAVVKRQVLEGVHAVVFLNKQMQAASKISIQIFDRRGEGEATFDQYDNLEPPIAAELVIRSKQQHQQHTAQQQQQQQQQQATPLAQYGSYGAPPVAQATPIAQPAMQQLGTLAQVPGLANLLGTLDANGIQKLLAGLQQQQQPQQAQQPAYQQQQVPQLGADLATLLAAAGRQQSTSQPQQPQQQQQQQQQQQGSYGTGVNGFNGGTAGLATLLGQAQQRVASQQGQQPSQQQSPPSAGQIGNIMETLAKWKQS